MAKELKLLVRDGGSFSVYYEQNGAHMVVFDSLDVFEQLAKYSALLVVSEMMAEYITMTWEDDPDNEPAFMDEVRTAIARVRGK